jgi:CheY-like chemotaxis protein
MLHVLLVDDQPQAMEMMALMLHARGFHVLTAANGAEALTLAQSHPIDVLVTDIVMENMDGLTLADLLEQQRPHLPVVFISGYSMEDEVKDRYPRCAFLVKPFRGNELANAISGVFKNDSAHYRRPPHGPRIQLI